MRIFLVYFKHFIISPKLFFSIVPSRRLCPLHCVYCIRNPNVLILNTTVCSCSVPSEGFVCTITYFLMMTTSCLDRVYFGGDWLLLLVMALTWERLMACGSCSTSTLCGCCSDGGSQAWHLPANCEVLRWGWALKCFACRSRGLQN